MTLAIAIRAAGERTLDACLHLTRQQAPEGTPIEVIRTAPFTKALRKTYAFGADSGADYLLTIDADVLPLPHLIDTFLAHAEAKPDLIERHAFGLCALTRKFRAIGPRLYLAAALPELIRHVEDHKRPESHAIRAITQPYSLKDVLCLHDFGQWRRDLYRKGALYARKHPKALLSKAFKPIDHPNYAAFRQGALEGGSIPLQHLMDRRRFPEVTLDEREPLPLDSLNDAMTEWQRTRKDLLP